MDGERRPEGLETAVVGLVSDTHGVTHPGLYELFEGVDSILHAGDVGRSSVLSDLEVLAPVQAVRGNVDHGDTGSLPETLDLEILGVRIHITHYGCNERHLEPTYGDFLRSGATDLLLFGHTHESLLRRVEGVWVVNPGSAGRPRFRSRPSAAILRIQREGDSAPAVDIELHDLPDFPPRTAQD